MPPDRHNSQEVIFEFITLGHSVKASAVHVATGIEVSVVGPASSPQKELQRIALQKLKQRIERERRKSRTNSGDHGGDDGSNPGGGIIA